LSIHSDGAVSAAQPLHWCCLNLSRHKWQQVNNYLKGTQEREKKKKKREEKKKKKKKRNREYKNSR